jgi:hypothetical protein
MSESGGRYDAPQGSTASTAVPLPPQPLADQPTEVVHSGAYDPRYDRVGGSSAAYPRPRSERNAATGSGSWPPHPDRYDQPPRVPADGTGTHPQYWDAPVVVRRADDLAGLLLLLAGIAAGLSLLVVWVHGGAMGLDLFRDGLDDLQRPQRLVDRDSWQPLAVVLGGAALFVLGLLMFIPARTHRFFGALALLVTLVVAAGVLVPLAELNWDARSWAVGSWFAAAVGGLGFLGALKALMTHPHRSRS